MVGSSLVAVSSVVMLMAAAPEPHDAYKIIVNPANPTSSLSRSQLSRMFLDPSKWDNGQPVLPADLTPASPLRELFSTAVHGMAAAAVVARWTNASAAGARMPVTLNSDADVIQYVRLKLGAIAYVSAAADVSAVKVLSIDWTGSSDAPSAAPDTYIQAVLTNYTRAIERRDMAALKRLWPTINGAQMLALRAEFDQSRPVRIELLDPKIDVKGDTALVMTRRRSILLTTSGTTMRVMTMTTLRLRHDASGWTIEDIRHQAER
jgi:hypothetical protein